MDKKAGIRFNENLHIEFIYNPDSDSVAVYRNGELLTDNYITPEQLASILEDYITKNDIATSSTNGLMSSTDKSKLDNIAAGAEVNVQSDWDETDTTNDTYIKNKPTIPTKVSDLTNDSGFIGNKNGIHNIQFVNSSTYVTLQISLGDDFLSLVFYDTGKVAIERFANGDWKSGVILRNDD